MIPKFPRIPAVQNGMVLSASTLNSYHRGLRYLLGQAHEPRLWHPCTSGWSGAIAGETWTSIFSGYAPYCGNTLYFNVWAKGPSFMKVQYYGDDSTWRDTAAAGSSGPDFNYNSTASIAGLANATFGRIYQWRVLMRSTTGNTCYGAVWALTIRPSVTGWVTPPTIVAAATSSATHFNAFRTDLYALYNGLTGYNHHQPGTSETGWGTTSSWLTIYGGAQRWKAGQSVYVSLEAKGWQANGRKYCEWGVDLHLPTRSGGDWTKSTIYTRQISEADLAAGGGEFVRFDYTIPNATFGALTEGTYYKLTYWLYLGGSSETNNNITVRRPIAMRVARVAPAAGWPTLTEWTRGDADVGATRLNAISAGLTQLYVGGGEALFPEIPVYRSNDALQDYACAVVHTKPWLVYYITAGQEPVIRYGANNEGEYHLPKDKVGQYVSIDLTSISQLTPGALYIVQGVVYAVEADVPYSG